jgi:hypothetical protein
LKTPVAFIIFNRPDTAERVFSEIAKARPPKLLVIADGPRLDRPGEIEKCSASRAIIDRVDWPCEVLTNYSEINLGCKNRVSSGIDWVFSQVEEAIILEDDCFPNGSFFSFCEEMLDHYRHDERIGMIAGTNFLDNKFEFSDSYYFSRYMSIWGWATWRRAWQNYDREIRYWPKLKQSRFLQSRFFAKDEQKYWLKVLDRVYAGVIDTWDYQWVLHNWTNSRLSIVPTVNLISNIGFRSDATHTANASIYSCLDTQRLAFPLSHPQRMYVNAIADSYSAKAQFTSLWRRLIRNRFKAILRRIIKGISVI